MMPRNTSHSGCTGSHTYSVDQTVVRTETIPQDNIPSDCVNVEVE